MKHKETSSHSNLVRIICLILVALMLLGAIYTTIWGISSAISATKESKETKQAAVPALPFSDVIAVTKAETVC